MHIEPGYLAQSKIAIANIAATGLLATYVPALLKRPALWLRTALAAVFFSALMQSFHMAVGPSELHFIGAMPIYLTLGFLPTLFGFAIGLLMQGLLFEPQDLIHLAVNSLSLIVPLLALHYTCGVRLTEGKLSAKQILKLDGIYYAGVTLMVGFWLSVGQHATAFTSWLTFAASYVSLVALEPVLTMIIVNAVAAVRSKRWIRACFDERLTGVAQA